MHCAMSGAISSGRVRPMTETGGDRPEAPLVVSLEDGEGGAGL